MSSLNQQDQELILQYYLHCGDDEQMERARELIAGNAKASKIYEKLESVLKPLESLRVGPCPDELAELVVSKLKMAASLSQKRLENLLMEEQERPASQVSTVVTSSRGFWRNVAEVAAVAAMILVVAGISFPTLSRMRQVAVCKSRLKRISEGIAMYANDHNGSLPSVATATGAPWWKVGDQGVKNQSNTRPLWLLVKNGYVDGKNFVCPGRKDAKATEFNLSKIMKQNDFSGRQYVNYSFMFMCDRVAKQRKSAKTVLMADGNPVFERIFDKAGERGFVKVRLDERMLKMLSTNHGQRGQNILFGDGHVKFAKSRIIRGDDIYTIRGSQIYSGNEIPVGDDDIFLAP